MSNENLEVKVNAFLNAVQLLFNSNNNQQKMKANKFIIELEKNSDSWDIACNVLQKENLQDEIYFNALQILKNKIKFDFGNYVENPIYIQNLLYFFEMNINRFKNKKNYLILNYCDCIGKAFLFTGDKFKDILIKFINKLSQDNNDIQGLLCLLIIFNSINENSNDDKIVIDKNSREKIIKNIKNISGDVFQYINFMINKLEDNNIKNNFSLKKFIINQILEIIINYINFPLNDDILYKFNNEYIPIVNFIFQINEENLEKQSECICSLLQFPLQNKNLSNLTQIIFTKIFEYKNIFYKTYNDINNEQISFYVDVFTTMVQNNLEDILDEKRYDLIQIIIDMIKICPILKIEIIFEFLDEFIEKLFDKKYTVHDIKSNFKNIFQDLFKNLIILTKFEKNIFKTLNKSKRKALKNDDDYNNTLDYRDTIKNFLENFSLNLGFDFIFDEILYPEFNNIILSIKLNQQDLSLWCYLESILYILSCIIITIKTEDKNINLQNIYILLYTILDIPKEYIQIIRTISYIIENIPNDILKDKELILKIIKYLIEGLDNKLLLKYVSKSAKAFLNKNKKIMSEFKLDLMSLYNKKLKNNVLVNDKYIDIIEGLIEVICYTYSDNNNDIIKKCIIEILEPWVLYLKEAKKLFENNNNKISEDNYKTLNNLLIIIKYTTRSMFEGLNKDNRIIMYDIFKELWNDILFILNKNLEDHDIVENIIQIIRAYTKNMKKNDFIEFIQNYIECLIKGYKLKPISSYLYGYEILISDYNEETSAQIKFILNNAFNQLCSITLHEYINNNKYDKYDIIEIISDFYGLLYRILKKNATILLDSELFEETIKSGLDNYNSKDIDISKNIISFLRKLISYEEIQFFKDIQNINITLYQKYKNIIQNKINNFSNLICQKILQTYIDVPSEQIFEDIDDLLYEFIIYQKKLVIDGIKYNIEYISNDILTNKEKEEFIYLINNFKEKEDEFNEFLKNFKNRCESKLIRDKGKGHFK